MHLGIELALPSVFSYNYVLYTTNTYILQYADVLGSVSILGAYSEKMAVRILLIVSGLTEQTEETPQS